MSVRAALGLGSNLGDRESHLRAAIADLDRLGTVVAVSSLYETVPVGGPPQDDYLNAVVVLETDEDPHALLAAALRIEQRMGRERREPWGPRTLDIDILLYGDRRIDEPGLTIPHPEMQHRRFVLEPLLEVWPDATLPDGTPLAPALAGVSDQVVRPAGSVWGGPAVLALFAVVAASAVLLWWIVGAVL